MTTVDLLEVKLKMNITKAGYEGEIGERLLYSTLGPGTKVRLSIPQEGCSGAVNKLLNKRRSHKFFVENRIYFYMKIFRQR
jgi:hypothetical protein